MEKVVPFRTGYGSELCAAWYDGSFLFVLFTLSSAQSAVARGNSFYMFALANTQSVLCTVAIGNVLYMFAYANTQSDADGRVSGTVEYDVFGEPVTETGVFAGSAGSSGGISALVFAYAGKPYDPVTGLSDYGFRDYAPTLARFTTVDPIRDGSNWYAYCNSDPVNYVDMWGLRDILGYDPNRETLGDFKGSRSPTQTEMELYIAAEDGNSTLNFGAIRIYDRLPTVREIRNAVSEYGLDMSGKTDEQINYIINNVAAMSLPGGKVYVPTDTNINGRSSANEVIALAEHEFKHQDQYSKLGIKDAFSRLMEEAQMVSPDPYNTPGYLENEANNFEQKANDLLNNGWTSSANTQTQNSTGCNTH